MKTKSLIAALCLVAIAACKKDPPPAAPASPAASPSAPVVVQAEPEAVPFKVESVTLGNAIGADKKVADAKNSFTKNDKIYASVASVGTSPSVTLKAVWNFKGEKGDVLVSEKEMAIAPKGRETTVFDVEKASGWPKGAYSVEVFADGVAVAKTEFIVAP